MTKEIIGTKLKLALENLDSLPAMPAIAHKLLALPLNTDEGETQMLRLIEQDPQLSARIVGLANSPALGVGRKISGVRAAAMLLGLERLKSVAIGIATMSRLANRRVSKNFDPQDLWSHSMTVAIVMNTLAQAMPKRIRPDENQIFLAGLLHDIGFMVLHYLDFEAGEELHHQLRLQPKRSTCEIELELLGVTHGHIGALLAQHWHLPAEIVEVLESHHAPASCGEPNSNPLVSLVNLAEKLLPDFGIVERTSETIDADEWRGLCIDPARADELSAVVNELAIQVVQLPDTPDAAQPDSNAGQQSAASLKTEPPAGKNTVSVAPAPAAEAPVGDSRFSILLAPVRALLGWIRGLRR